MVLSVDPYGPAPRTLRSGLQGTSLNATSQVEAKDIRARTIVYSGRRLPRLMVKLHRARASTKRDERQRLGFASSLSLSGTPALYAATPDG